MVLTKVTATLFADRKLVFPPWSWPCLHQSILEPFITPRTRTPSVSNASFRTRRSATFRLKSREQFWGRRHQISVEVGVVTIAARLVARLSDHLAARRGDIPATVILPRSRRRFQRPPVFVSFPTVVCHCFSLFGQPFQSSSGPNVAQIHCLILHCSVYSSLVTACVFLWNGDAPQPTPLRASSRTRRLRRRVALAGRRRCSPHLASS